MTVAPCFECKSVHVVGSLIKKSDVKVLGYSILCMNCGNEIGGFKTKEEAIEKWNTTKNE